MEIPRSSHNLWTCHALRPRGCRRQHFSNQLVGDIAFRKTNNVGHPEYRISGLNHFNLAAYGLSSRCLRLTHFVASMSSRLASECGERRFSEGTFTPTMLTPRGALVIPTPTSRSLTDHLRGEYVIRESVNKKIAAF